ncbi:RNA polymerase sigma factor [Gimesia aquarii]|uniref:RNA polymerase sigma factor n=1 Tax=Gimesia aquarii TaxID=2527964 RepID=A0A517VWW9_9PLAN|nr:sigma-70 family RNA polymerase sigma factor [Gimesia aquarii]QDT97507.1 RNA polymerase sigma factor [Gimesia aquarii]
MATGNDGKLAPEIVHQLFEQHAAELRAFLTGLLRDHDFVDEVIQLTFSKALQSGNQAKEETRKGWLFKVAYHESMALLRRSKIDKKSLKNLCHTTAVYWTEKPEHQLLENENIEQVRQALSKLPENQQEVVIARIYQNKTFKEIAQEYELPLGTVLTRMRIAIKTLSKQLDNPAENR